MAWVRPCRDTGGPLVVCEGLPDAYTAAGAGFAAVGVLGAGYPDATVADRIRHAVSKKHGALVVFDADAAGRAGAARLVALLEQRHVPATSVSPPAGDLNEWARTDPTWSTTLRTRLTVVAPVVDVVSSVPTL